MSSSFQVEQLEDARYIPLIVLGCTSSTLSMIGSSCIIYKSSRRVQRQVLHRLLCALSISDLFSSAASFLTPFLLPRAVGLPGAVGSLASCSAVGFLLTGFIMVGCCYNAYISLYYLLIVRRNWKEYDFHSGMEMGAHGIAVLVPLAINTAAVATQSINPSPLINVCLYGTYPWGCNNHDDIDCQRSNSKAVISIVIPALIFLLTFTLLGFVGSFLVWWTVRSTVRRSSAYRVDNPQTEERMRQVCLQAILYSLVYFNTFFWPSLGVVLTEFRSSDQIQINKTKPGHYCMQVLYWSLFPLQGALNFFVYTRQDVARWRKMEPDRSLFWIYRQVLSSKAMPNQSTMGRSMPGRHTTGSTSGT